MKTQPTPSPAPIALKALGITSLLFLLAPYFVVAQTNSTDPDVAFQSARQLAFNGKRTEGRKLALQILATHPTYTDVRTFVGRTYAWDGQYDSARYHFAAAAAQSTPSLENYLAWADAEGWDDKPAKALAVTGEGLQHFPADVELQYRKAKFLAATGRLADARSAAGNVLKLAPQHKAAYTLLQSLRGQLAGSSVGAGISYDGFTSTYQPAVYSFVQASRSAAMGSVTARLNYASRFGKTGVQPEVDLYPKIYKGVYAYLNYGYSTASVFPQHRAGAELYTSLPLGLEASAGMRLLYFGQRPVKIFTGSLGWYTGNYWLSLRPTITPDGTTTSVSASLTVRRYFKNADHYLSLRSGAGFSPELLNQALAGSKDFYTLQSQSGALAYQHPFSKHWLANGAVSLTRQELLFAPKNYVLNYGLSAAVQYRFR